MGVKKFFIADNDSTDGTSELLAALDVAGIATHIPFPQVEGRPPQLSAYRQIVGRHRKDADWLAFIDGDEFLTPADINMTLPGILSSLASDVGAVGINWACYGSSGQKYPSNGLVMERFSMRAADEFGPNFHYKSIARSKALAQIGTNPHYVELKSGYRYSHADGVTILDHPIHGRGLSSVIKWSPLRVNHYVVKSRAEFDNKKIPRGRASVLGFERDSVFFERHDKNEIVDPMHPELVARTNIERRLMVEKIANIGKEELLEMAAGAYDDHT